MAASVYQVFFQNTSVSAGNYQIVDFALDDAMAGSHFSGGEEWAALMVYLAIISGGFASGTTISQVLYRAAGSPGGVAIPWDSSSFTTVAALATTAGYTVPAMTSYSFSLGSGILAPLGTSISVSELTATAGRTGRGRHFLPFVSQGVISAGGTVGTGHIALVEGAYTDVLLGGAVATVPALLGDALVVTGPMSSTLKPITSVKCQPIFSNLESRRR